MHDIEWVDSGDYSDGDEHEAIKACLAPTEPSRLVWLQPAWMKPSGLLYGITQITCWLCLTRPRQSSKISPTSAER
jgi:hypothetical protein